MEAWKEVKLKSLAPYRHLFPKAQSLDQTVKMGASVYDTVDVIPEVIRRCRWQVEKFVDQELRGLSVYQACEKLWHFVKYHIKYKRDKRGVEQVRSPRRLIADGFGDCDCFSTFIGSCLDYLNIPFVNRITKYEEDHFQHIYPIVPLGNGKQIVMDCVVQKFNYEEPYTEKKDYKYNMELQVLDGIEKRHINVDAQDLFDDYGSELGAFSLKNITTGIKDAVQNVTQTVQTAAQNVAQTVTQAVQDPKTILHAVNQINPAVALLRVGFLGSMKLNILDVAGRLRWAYLTKEQAMSKGIDPVKYDQLAKVLAKAQEIFYGAGGNNANLREAILTGSGNKDNSVAGLGYLAKNYTRHSKLSDLLGAMYQEESKGLEGADGLAGEPVTATAIAAASAAVGALAALIKNIGDIFQKRRTEAVAAQSDEILPANSMMSNPTNDGSVTIPDGFTYNIPGLQDNSSSTYNNTPAGRSTGTEETANGTFWQNNTKTIIGVGVGVVVIGATVGGYIYYKNKTNKVKSALNGIGKRKKGKPKGGTKRKKGSKRKSVLDLM